MNEAPVRRVVLSSGLTVILEPVRHVRSVALGFYLRSGSAAEPDGHGGTSHFLEHLLFKGTTTRSTADIALLVDLLGGDVDAFTGKEYTSFYAHVLDEQLLTALELLIDLVRHPSYTDQDIEMERSVILEEIRMVEDTPDDLVNEIFLESFWGDHPLGRPILGTEAGVKSMQRRVIEEHYRETFRPSNMVFVASGNFRPSQLLRALEKAFPGDATPSTAWTWPKPAPRQHLVLRKKAELEQVHLLLGSRGLPQQSELRYATAVYNTILGGGMSSRLFQKVREKEGLAYSIASYHNGYRHAGYQAVYAATSPKNLRRVLELVLLEMKQIRREGVTAKELAYAKLSIKGSILLSLESTVSRMSGFARQEYYFGRSLTTAEIIGHVDAVTHDDILEVARETSDPTSISLTMIGNMKRAGVTIDDLKDALA